MDVIASDCSAYGFGDQRSVEEGTVVTSKGGVKLRVYRERHDTRAGLYPFSAWGWVLVYCGYAEVPSCEKSNPGMYSFLHLKRFQLDWSNLVAAAALISSGQFAAEWYVQIWIRCKKQLFWSKQTLPSSRPYLSASEGVWAGKWRTLGGACCFCNLEDSQHLEMLPVVVHTIVRGFLSWMNLFETVLETFKIVSKGFELWFLHVTVWTCAFVRR